MKYVFNNIYSMDFETFDLTYSVKSYYTNQFYNDNFPTQRRAYYTFGIGVEACLGGASATQEYYSNILWIW